MEACQRCAICLDACPVYGVDPGFPGPKALVAWWRRQAPGQVPSYMAVAGCNGCRRCQIACPAGVPVADLIQSWKLRARVPTLTRSGRGWFLARGASWGRWVGPLAKVINWMGKRRLGRRALAWGLGISWDQPLPQFSSTPETAAGWARTAASRPTVAAPEAGQLEWPDRRSKPMPALPPAVAVFVGCFYRYCQPQALQALKRLLGEWGCRVYLLDRACCGLPALANGEEQPATRWAQKNLRDWDQWASQLRLPKVPLLTLCPSCALVLKEVYPNLIPGASALSLSRSVVDASQFILSHWAAGGGKQPQPDQPFQLPDTAGQLQGPQVTGQPQPRELSGWPHLRVAYHLPCHLAAQAIGAPGLELLRRTGDLDIVPLKDSCCGAAGTHALKQEHYRTSQAVARPLLKSLAASQAQLVVSECGMCQVQLSGHTGLPAAHPIELLVGLKHPGGKLLRR